MKQTKDFFTVLLALAILAIGVVGGHYHGVAQTLLGVMGDGITCKMGVNPITQDMLD